MIFSPSMLGLGTYKYRMHAFCSCLLKLKNITTSRMTNYYLLVVSDKVRLKYQPFDLFLPEQIEFDI